MTTADGEGSEAAERLLEPATVEDVIDRTEQLRAEQFDSVPKDLVAAVLAAEQDSADDRATAARTVGRVIDGWLAANSAATDTGEGGSQ